MEENAPDRLQKTFKKTTLVFISCTWYIEKNRKRPAAKKLFKDQPEFLALTKIQSVALKFYVYMYTRNIF